MPEYGRNVQKMINYAITLEDREKRNKLAHIIVTIMSQMNPKMKDTGDFRQKLWDHLHIISDFKLDVDSPFPVPPKDILHSKPDPITYADNNIAYRHYGKNIKKIIDKAIEYEEGPEKEALIKNIANHMKKSYLNWNRESVNDELIYKHLEELSKDKLKVSEDVKLNETSDILARNKKKKFNGKQRDGSDRRGKGWKKQ
jgi:hypothetical protein